MRLVMNPNVATSYRSKSQIARIVTEDWALNFMYCPACDSNHLSQLTANTQAVDYACRFCDAAFQLKSSARWNEQRIPDAGYDAMIKAIRSDNVPNLLVMQYSSNWHVSNLLLVPSFFFTEKAIERRKPLSPTARRAGWVGCNILLREISHEGKIRLVTDGNVHAPDMVRSQYQRIKPLKELSPRTRGWTFEVLQSIGKIKKAEFVLDDLYKRESDLALLFPANRNVRAKIRQQLQVLRDIGVVQFLGKGRYRLSH